MDLTRRQFALGLGAAAAASLLPELGLASVPVSAGGRTLSFLNLHTGEKGKFTYREYGRLVPEEVSRLYHLMRDHRTGDVHPIDSRLLDLLYALQQKTGTGKPFEIISAYRSPKTNAMLASHSNGVASKSLHMTGQAIDICLGDVPLYQLRNAALKLRAGGVGFYPNPGFVHVDTGRVRRW
jgi:uncharacterized protein YcbK (DUF882 family)